MTQETIKVVDINTDIAVESIYLDDCERKDPVDRFIIATARVLDIPLMTHDEKIIAYAKKGHVRLA
jgi:PIN domain nuclease of toxin-antitoxin system